MTAKTRYATLLPWMMLSLCLLQGCWTHDPQTLVRTSLRRFAGPQAIDCGRTPYHGNRSGQRACVFEAYRQNKPFLVQYEVAGKEDLIEEGLAEDAKGSGLAAEAVADDSHSIGFGSGIDHRTFIQTPCRSPLTLRESVIHTVEC